MNQNIEYSTTLVPQTPLGWHMRPVGLLVSVARMFESDIVVECGQKIASAKSLLGILTLGAGRGAKLYVSARGRDAQMAIRAIKKKFASCPEPEETLTGSLPSIPQEGDKSNKREERTSRGASAAAKSKPRGRISTTFTWHNTPDAQKVYLVGDFNEWDTQAEPMTKRKGQFSKSLKLAPGQYQYKFVVDGEWKVDPAAPLVRSGLGSTNNVITV